MSSLSTNTNAKSMNGLIIIESDDLTSENIECDNLIVNLEATAPTVISTSNDNHIATTAFVNNAISGIGSNYVDLTSTQTITGEKTFSNANTLISGNLITNSIRSASATTDINIGQNLTTGDINMGTTFIGPTMNIALNWGSGSNSGQLALRGGSFTLASTGNYNQSSGASFQTNISTNQSDGVMAIGTLPARSGAININTGNTSTAPINISSGTNANAPITIGSTASTTQTCDMNAITNFSKIVSCPIAPTTSNNLCNKDYVDNAISSGGSGYVNLTGNQTISGQKTFTDFNLFLNDNGINSNNGTLAFQDSTGDGALMYYNNDDSSGVGGLRIVSAKYGMAYSTTTGAGEHVDFLSEDINFRSTDSCIFSEFAIPPPTGGQKNQLKRGAIYENTSTIFSPTITFTNGQATDNGVSFSALLASVPIGNTCSMIRVSIPFYLLAWSTFGLPSATATIGLRFDSFSVVFLKNGLAYTPTKSFSYSPATGTTLNWNKTGAQSNIQGISAYFGNLEIAFNIDTNNTTTDSYQVRITPNATITNYSINFDGFKFVCRNATGGQTNGIGFRTTSATSFTGGTLTFAGGNPAFVDTSITKLSFSYPTPASYNYCFMPNNNNITPAGMISAFVASTPPIGWLLCNGASVSILTYPNLFNVIAFTYGGTFASGNFNLPNFQGVFLRGNGTQTINSVAYASGAVGTAQQDSVLALSAITNQGYWNIDAGGGGASRQVKGRIRIATDPIDSGAFGAGIDASFPRQNTTENRPVNHSVYYIIKW